MTPMSARDTGDGTNHIVSADEAAASAAPQRRCGAPAATVARAFATSRPVRWACAASSPPATTPSRRGHLGGLV
ncbi:MAG: hypothetical protein U0S36_13670 [Candidatus Nanopelagicales bacterium]